MKRVASVLSICLALTVGGKANATPITLTYEGAAYGFRTADYTSTPSGVTPIYDPSAAGAFKMSGPVGDFLAFCLDITRALQTTSQYEETNTPWSFNTFSTNTRQSIQTLFDAAYHVVDSRDSSAAFQILLWDAVYEDGTNPFAGIFAVNTNIGSGVQNKVTDILTLVDGHDDTKKYNLTFFEATGTPQSQSLVTATAVPLPAAALLLLTALGGGVLVSRRRKAA